MRSKHFLPELEGIRGYAFIVVFLVHYTYGVPAHPPGPGPTRYLIFLVAQISWVAVPVFFVLSGYLITGILYDTRHRQGFFSVFYKRRAVRILPLYYVLVTVYVLLNFFTGRRMPLQQLWFAVYLQNLPGLPIQIWSNDLFSIGHLWSLAVEEQFYLLWPVVIWLIPHRKPLLRASYGAIAISFIARIIWPLVHLDASAMYGSTLTRGDGIMLGAVLALHSRRTGFSISRLVVPARWTVAGCLALVYARVYFAGNSLPLDFIGISCITPAMNLLAGAIIVLTLAPETALHRACLNSKICRLGGMSYSVYVVHELLQPWIQLEMAPWLSLRIGHPASRVVVIVAAAAYTYVAAKVTYRWLELPAVRTRDRFRYGPEIIRKRRSGLAAPRPFAALPATNQDAA